MQRRPTGNQPRRLAALAALGISLAFAWLAGCERAKPLINGLAGFELGATTLAVVSGKALRCYTNPQTSTERCFIRPATSIAGRVPDVQIDFDGKTLQSTVAEITLTIPGCRFDSLASWLEDKLGKASNVGQKRAYWAQKLICVAAEESSPARCQVTAVKADDKQRIAAIRGSTP